MDEAWGQDDLLEPSSPSSASWPLSLSSTAALLVLLLVLWLGVRPILWWQYSHIPGGSLALPFYGNLTGFRDWDLARVLHWSGVKHGRHVYKIWVGSTPCVVINQPELAHHVCMRVNARFKDSAAGEHLMLPRGPAQLLDGGILASNGDSWRQARRAFEKAIMQPPSLCELLPKMQLHVSLLCDGLSAHLHGSGACNILEELEAMNLKLLGSAAYGSGFQADAVSAPPAGGAPAAPQNQAGEDKLETQQLHSQLVKAVKAMIDEVPHILVSSSSRVLAGLFMPVLRPLFARLLRGSPDPLFLRRVQICTAVADASAAVVEAVKAGRRHACRAESASGPAKQPVSSESSLLGQLLESREGEPGKQPKLTDEEIAAQPLAFMLAGSSLSSTLAFCVYLLSLHPTVEAKVIEEVDQALYQAGKRAAQAGHTAPGAAATTRELHDVLCAGAQRELRASDLPYTEAVLKETMRMFPSVPFLRRQAPPEGMDVDRVRIPGDAVLLIPISNFHHDEQYFPQPGLFRPERFLEAQPASLHSTMLQRQFAATTPYAFIPFGVGGRMCVGFKFSLIHGVLSLAALYTRFKFRLHPGQVPLPIHSGLVVAPSDGVWVNIQERPPWVPELPSPTSQPTPPPRLSRRPSTAAELSPTSAGLLPPPGTPPGPSSPGRPVRLTRWPSAASALSPTSAGVPAVSTGLPVTPSGLPSLSRPLPPQVSSPAADLPSPTSTASLGVVPPGLKSPAAARPVRLTRWPSAAAALAAKPAAHPSRSSDQIRLATTID